MSLVQQVFEVSHAVDTIANQVVSLRRNRASILRSVTSEVGELAQEVDVAEGTSYKVAGADGVVGEAIDVIISALDIIYFENPKITEQEIKQIAARKLTKWMDKCMERANKFDHDDVYIHGP